MTRVYKRLDWDTEFFGFGVASILAEQLSQTELAQTLRELRDRDYRLAYWRIPSVNSKTCRTALEQGGFLADERLTYVKKLPKEPPSMANAAYSPLAYPEATPAPALIELALQSAENSRFRVDPKFPDELCDKLYTTWISRSVNKELARETLVVNEAEEHLGLITLCAGENGGVIGLVAVAAAARGRGVGKALMLAAENHFIRNRDTVAQVVTQKRNRGACGLYESCGFTIEQIDSTFHFWI